MFGRKTMTPPTPLMIPPTSNSRREPSGIRPYPVAEPSPASIHSAGMPPSENVVWKVIHISSKNGQSPDPVRHHAVDSVGRDMLLPCISGAIGFFEGAGDKSVLGIRDDRFGGFSVAVLELFAEPGGRGVYLVGVGGPGGDDLANVLVVAQQPDRQIARRVACHQILVFPILWPAGSGCFALCRRRS